MYLDIYMYIHIQMYITTIYEKGNEFEKELGRAHGRVWREEKEGENYVGIIYQKNK